jgi:hypothetical protein
VPQFLAVSWSPPAGSSAARALCYTAGGLGRGPTAIVVTNLGFGWHGDKDVFSLIWSLLTMALAQASAKRHDVWRRYGTHHRSGRWCVLTNCADWC